MTKVLPPNVSPDLLPVPLVCRPLDLILPKGLSSKLPYSTYGELTKALDEGLVLTSLKGIGLKTESTILELLDYGT